MVSLAGPNHQPQPLFELGRVVITNAAKGTLDERDVLTALDRHALGDWGELSSADKGMNDHALSQGGRILSQYTDRNGKAFYIISENLSQQNYTTIMLPEDY